MASCSNLDPGRKVAQAGMPSLGHFRSCDFDNVYEPAEDTYLFLDALQDELCTDENSSGFLARHPPRVVLELGPGSGVISTFLLQKWKSHFGLAIDINRHAACSTTRTAAENGVGDRFDCIQGDLLTSLRKTGCANDEKQQLVDVYVFNPPYVPSPASELEEKDSISLAWAGGELGREVIDRFLEQIAPRLVGSAAVLYLLLEERNDLVDTNKFAERLGLSGVCLLKKKVPGEKLSIWRFADKDSTLRWSF